MSAAVKPDTGILEEMGDCRRRLTALRLAIVGYATDSSSREGDAFYALISLVDELADRLVTLHKKLEHYGDEGGGRER